MSNKNIQVTLANRPTGWVKESDFKIVETDIPKASAGQVLVKKSLPLARSLHARAHECRALICGQCRDRQVMVGGTVGEVMESNNPKFKPGDTVSGYFGWQQYGVSSGNELQKVDRNRAAVRLSRRGRDAGSDRMVGSARYRRTQGGRDRGGVGSGGRGGQHRGADRENQRMPRGRNRGRQGQCDLVVKEFGFDACVDYKGGNLAKDLRAAAPKGIDIYFENVGGEILETIALQLNPFARIPLCGLISQYNEVKPHGLDNLVMLLINRVKLQGFIVSDFAARSGKAVEELAGWVRDGQDQVSRDDRQRHRERAARFPRDAQGRKYRQAIGKAVLKSAGSTRGRNVLPS